MESQQNKMMPLIAAGLLVCAVGAGFISFKMMPQAEDNRVNQHTPKMEWLTQKAKECQGDFYRLSPADQQKANELTSNSGPMTIGMIYSHLKK